MKSKYVKKHECVIIGGGAAGMMAAVQLAGYGIDNCIIEHTGKNWKQDITDRQWQV